MSHDEDWATGSLISAAPNLLAACEAAIPEIRCLYQQLVGHRVKAFDGSVGKALDLLATAIAKATETNARLTAIPFPEKKLS